MFAHLMNDDSACASLCADFYTPIEQVLEARSRQRNDSLVSEIVKFARPRGELLRRLSAQPLILWRAVASPSLETHRFLALAKSVGSPPQFWEMPNDVFTPTANRTKAALAKLRIIVGSDRVGDKTINVSVVDFNACHRWKFRDMNCRDGTPFIEFHHRLLAAQLGQHLLSAIYDQTEFFAGEKPRQYYERLFALLTCFGALAESYLLTGSEGSFFEQVVSPSFEAVRRRFGARPMIVRLLTAGEEAHPRWESYPEGVRQPAFRAAGR